MELVGYFKLMAEHAASDLFLSAGARPSLKVDGVTRHLGEIRLTSAQVHDMAFSVMGEKQQHEFESELEMNLAVNVDDIGRFRVNIYRQRGEVAMVVRYITNRIPSIEHLHLPPILKEFIMEPRGLILVVGATNSGKSTALAAMIDYRNTRVPGHILTIEEPIEYLHEHKQSVVDQREIGLDTLSYGNALKNAMREAPDVIMIGEIRDSDIMRQALAYAETGHLCLATLHAANSTQALDRILHFFSETMRPELLLDLSLNLKAVVSLRLLRDVDGKRLPAVEVLRATPHVVDLIQKGEIHKLKEAMKLGVDQSMRTFDEALYRLFVGGRIAYGDAIVAADSRTDLALRLRLEGIGPEEDPGSPALDQFIGGAPSLPET